MSNIMKLIKNKLKGSTTMPPGTGGSVNTVTPKGHHDHDSCCGHGHHGHEHGHHHEHHHVHGAGCCDHEHDHEHVHHHGAGCCEHGDETDEDDVTTPGKGCC